MANDGNRVVVFGSQLIGVLIVVVGLLTQQAELRSPRPSGSKTQVAGEPDPRGDKFARLWDDPLDNLPTFKVAAPTATRGAQPTPGELGPGEGPPPSNAVAPRPLEAANIAGGGIANAPAASGTAVEQPIAQQSQRGPIALSKVLRPASKALVIWNILDARPLSEVRELRLRTRYAIVSALMTARFLPERESVLLPLFPPAAPQVAGSTAAVEPIGYYEAFLSSDEKWPIKRVLLLWTPKQISLHPQIVESVRDQLFEQESVDRDTIVRFIHHGGSEDLAAYAATGSPLPNTTTSFVRATIPLNHLRPAVVTSTSTAPPPLRPIRTDDLLADAIVGELLLRIPLLNRDPKAGTEVQRPRVVIFTESDTNYSRAIAAEVKAKIGLRAPAAAVEVYSYLRALDGRPEDVRTPTKPEKAGTSDVAGSLLQGRAISEQSFGTSQFDYLRRLSLYLDERAEGKGEICAAGVLGSDVYDKMLVLQALRARLPAAVFFTTDLDALYLERDNQPFTRNLIVASADNLKVDLSAEGGGAETWNLPPMRDSYQTVLAKHIWTILRAGADSLDAAAASPNSPAYLAEIVAGKDIDLNPDKGVPPDNAIPALRNLPLWSFVIFVLSLANGFLIYWAISTRGMDPNKPAAMRPIARAFAYTEIAVASLAMVVLLVKVLSSDGLLLGEPLSLGASIWPSVVIRLLAFVVAILLLLIASRSFATRAQQLEDQLRAALPSHLELPLAGTLPRDLVRFACFLFTEKEARCPKQTFSQLLDDVFDSRRRRWRIIIASVIYLLVSMWLFIHWPPVVPARGAASFLIEKLVLASGVALYIIHLVYCLDLHLFAFTLLRILRSFYSPAVARLTHGDIHPRQMLTAVSTLTTIIGKTLLYPLTVLILIILSRLQIFDAWKMTPSLTITFAAGAILLISASVVLWRAGSELKRDVLAAESTREKEQIDKINEGVFAAWYQQPIFAAIFSAAAVFGSLGLVGPLGRLFFGSS